MKCLLIVLVVLCSTTSQAATWTIHGCKDNYSKVFWANGVANQWNFVGYVQFDYTWDVLYPDQVDSGTYYTTGDGIDHFTYGYQDVLSLDVDDRVQNPPGGWPIGECLSFLSGPAPDYVNYPGEVDLIPLTQPGEYWLDFGPGGIPRVVFGSAGPIDFGKWAWDGSINPHFTEPMLAKKHHGKK